MAIMVMMTALKSGCMLMSAMSFGAGMYIIRVEHPARTSMTSVESVVENFARTLELAKTYQGCLNLLSCIGGLVVYRTETDPFEATCFLIGCLTLLATFPFTFLALALPINSQFKNKTELMKKGEHYIKALHLKWVEYHAFRTFLTGLALAAYFYPFIDEIR